MDRTRCSTVDYLEVEAELLRRAADGLGGAVGIEEPDRPIVGGGDGKGLGLEQRQRVRVLDRCRGSSGRSGIDDQDVLGVWVGEPDVEEVAILLGQLVGQPREPPRTRRRPGPGSSSARVSR